MGEHALALGVVIIAWWASTAAVMRLAWQARAAHRWSVAAISVVALGGVAVVWTTRDEASAGAAYAAFGAALALWAWHELTFLLGWVTGPRRKPCPPEARGFRRFRLATATVIHHEVALAATLGVLALMLAGSTNRVALWTFAGLWVLRLSAKLNLFAGVAHVSDELAPPRLRYLATYFRRRRGVSVWLWTALVGCVLATVALARAATLAAPGHEATELSLLASLALLGVVEHLFLAFPMQDARLWRWVLDGIPRPDARRRDLPLPAFAAGTDERPNGENDG